MDIRFTDGVYCEDFGGWMINVEENPLGCPRLTATDPHANRIVLDADGEFLADARWVPVVAIERMIAVWRALGEGGR